MMKWCFGKVAVERRKHREAESIDYEVLRELDPYG